VEILEPSGRTVPRIEYNWDIWLVFDGRPRILERFTDFKETPQQFKRTLTTEAAKRGLDVIASVKKGQRVLYQVFNPSGEVPELPAMLDARVKYPWALWLNGEEHEIVKGRNFHCGVATFKSYAYKASRERGLKIQLTWPFADVAVIRAYKPETQE
jgi:hypothetical protein